MFFRSEFLWPAFAAAACHGAIMRSGSMPAAVSASKGISRYDEDPVSPPAIVRRVRWRGRLALSGQARNSLVLVSDLAGAAGRAGIGQPADRCASGAVAAGGCAAGRKRI